MSDCGRATSPPNPQPSNFNRPARLLGCDIPWLRAGDRPRMMFLSVWGRRHFFSSLLQDSVLFVRRSSLLFWDELCGSYRVPYSGVVVVLISILRGRLRKSGVVLIWLVVWAHRAELRRMLFSLFPRWARLEWTIAGQTDGTGRGMCFVIHYANL
jgi:hypothetical protein